MEDKSGAVGKSKFVKWFCINFPNQVWKLTFGTSSQLRSSVLSADRKLVYFVDRPKTKPSNETLENLISVCEDIKIGHVVSVMYGNYRVLIMNTPHIVLVSNSLCHCHMMVHDRWRKFKINKKTGAF